MGNRWRVKGKITSNQDLPIGFKPLIKLNKPLQNPKYFVVDGLQRLISFALFRYGEVEVLHKQKEYIKQSIRIYYNPTTNQIGMRECDVGEPAILLSDILSGKLSKYENLKGEDKDKLYDFKYKILNYEVPVYVLSPEYDIIDIANIFDRINSKGTKVVLAQIITAYLAVTLSDTALDLWNYTKELR